MNPAAEINRTLRSMRWRMVARDFLRHSVRATLFFFALLMALTAVAWWAGEFRPVPAEIPFVLGWPPAAGALAGLVLAVLGRPATEDVARTVDAIGATRDRLLTGLLFSRKPDPTAMESLALAARYVRGRDFRPLLPIRPPRELAWLGAPIAVLALLWWDAMHMASTRERRAETEAAAISGTTDGIERLAREIERQADHSKEAELKKLAGRLRQSAEQMRAEAARGGDAQKAALRELAMLEQWVKELRRPGTATPDELKTLADALMKHEQTREAAKDIETGDLARASKKLGQAAQEQNAASAEKLRQTIEQALDHLARRKEEISRQIEKLREQAGENGGGRQDLLRQIAEMLDEQQRSGNVARREKDAAQKGGGKPLTDEDLKKLLGALENLKNQQQGGEPQEGEAGQRGEDSQERVATMNFGPGKNPERDSGEGVDFPTGLPGDGKDKGTTENPLGKQAAAPGEAGPKDRLSGKLGAGESLSAATPGVATGGGKAARRYRELYDAAAADAEDAVTQENIPLGSRLLIKRYFEAIRPRP
ncbi:MAG: hypothetical protein ABMA01_08425 [Chthoniobacteraceae bacterium]